MQSGFSPQRTIDADVSRLSEPDGGAKSDVNVCTDVRMTLSRQWKSAGGMQQLQQRCISWYARPAAYLRPTSQRQLLTRKLLKSILISGATLSLSANNSLRRQKNTCTRLAASVLWCWSLEKGGESSWSGPWHVGCTSEVLFSMCKATRTSSYSPVGPSVFYLA